MLFVLLSVLIVKGDECTLSNLYSSEDIKFAVYEHLGEIFDVKFDEVILEAKKHSPYSVNAANHFRRKLKREFIEEGRPLETIEDLDLALKRHHYISTLQFREEKFQFDNRKKNESNGQI